jgi:predicted phage-related endonuclease
MTYEHLGGYSTGYIATLAGLAVTVAEVPRDEEKIGRILTLLDRFWEYVQADSWPPPTGHPDDRDSITDAHPVHTPGRKVRETRAVAEARRELRLLNEQDGKHGARTRRKSYLAGIVTAHMGDAELLISAHDEVVARWPAYPSQRVDTKRLREDHPEIAEAYSSTTTSRRLTLS